MRVRYWEKGYSKSNSVYAQNGSLLYFHTVQSAEGFIRGKLIEYLELCARHPLSYKIANEPIVYDGSKFILHPQDFDVDYIFEILDDIDTNMYSKSCIWEFEGNTDDVRRIMSVEEWIEKELKKNER